MSGYDYRALRSKHPYDAAHMEKVCRIGDVLARVSQIPFLLDRLSLYGGTALNFIHFSQPQRLSVDIDFNYRHQGEERDWGDIRGEIDDAYKQILYTQGYRAEDIKIDASYPLSRFTINYVNHQGINDSFKIETGYMRRMPILDTDARMSFRHLGNDTRHTVMTPRTEEIYSNKWITLLDRATPRDLYDVHVISEAEVNQTKLRKCGVLESLMSLDRPLTDIDPGRVIHGIGVDEALRAVLRVHRPPDFEEIKARATQYSEALIDSLTINERRCIELFYSEKRFEPNLLELEDMNPGIRNHPAIKWALKQLF